MTVLICVPITSCLFLSLLEHIIIISLLSNRDQMMQRQSVLYDGALRISVKLLRDDLKKINKYRQSHPFTKGKKSFLKDRTILSVVW